MTLQRFAVFLCLLAVTVGRDLESEPARSDTHSASTANTTDSIIIDHAAHALGRNKLSDDSEAAGPVVDSDGTSSESLKVPSTSRSSRVMRRQRQVHLDNDEGDDGEVVRNSVDDDVPDEYTMPEALLQDADQLSDGQGAFFGWDRRRRRRRVDCSYSTWTSYTACSKSCGSGIRKRTRHMMPAQHGGKACAEATSLEQFSCNSHLCQDHCTWSPWGAWGYCSHTCGNGQKTRTRSYTGSCGSGGTETLGCNTFACPVDCYNQPWSQWGACTKTCVEGGEMGYKTRDRAKIGPFNGGIACNGHTVDDLECNVFTCPKDCEVGQWSSWSTCTQTCSVSVLTHGYKLRSRTSTAATNGGKVCAANWQMEHCNNFLCSFDCYFLDWGGWGPCSRSCTMPGEAAGQRIKIRSMVGPGMGGKACEGATEMSFACNDFMCPQECKFSAWSSFGECTKTCGVGGRTRTRTKEGAGYGGLDCVGPTTHWEACNGHGCPIDCKWTEWNAWMPCTKTCGGHGTRQRARSYDPSPANGGADCPGAFLEMTECNKFPCPVDCIYEEWLEWGLCSVSCDEGVKSRIRLKNITEFFGGAECPESATEEASCDSSPPCPRDCDFSEWGNWTECSANCGTGQRHSYRVLLSAVNGGSDECPEGADNRTEDCEEAPCAPQKNGARYQDGRLARWIVTALCVSSLVALKN